MSIGSKMKIAIPISRAPKRTDYRDSQKVTGRFMEVKQNPVTLPSPSTSARPAVSTNRRDQTESSGKSLLIMAQDKTNMAMPPKQTRVINTDKTIRMNIHTKFNQLSNSPGTGLSRLEAGNSASIQKANTLLLKPSLEASSPLGVSRGNASIQDQIL